MFGSAPGDTSGSDGRGKILRVVDVIRRVAGALLRHAPLGPEQRRLLLSVRACRTPALGGEVLFCPHCGQVKEVFHSCRNRHCPNCQAQTQDVWIAKRAEAMLPVPHFHVVFTLPSQLRALCRVYPRPMYDLLLRSCGDVLVELGEDVLKAQLGVTIVLHTWTRDLSYHVHAHCIVSAGGWDRAAQLFRPVRRKGYLFPAARMKAMFRTRLLRGLRGLVQQGVVTLPADITFPAIEASLPDTKRWVVHIEPPFGMFQHVLAYLGRYTHRVGISNSRLHDVTDDEVTFATRDGKTCTLSHDQFTRRFLQHVLPDGFKKIRHYGLYASGATQHQAALAALPQPPPPSTPQDHPDTPRLDSSDTASQTAPREPIWRERRCPNCGVPLVLFIQMPRPPRLPWRPP